MSSGSFRARLVALQPRAVYRTTVAVDNVQTPFHHTRPWITLQRVKRMEYTALGTREKRVGLVAYGVHQRPRPVLIQEWHVFVATERTSVPHPHICTRIAIVLLTTHVCELFIEILYLYLPNILCKMYLWLYITGVCCRFLYRFGPHWGFSLHSVQYQLREKML